jgi:methyl-accepting chemotaxis protein
MDGETAAIVQGLKDTMNGITRRLEKLEGLTTSVQDLALSIRELATKQSAMEEKVDEVTNSVNELKAKPGDKWDKAVLAIMTAAIGALVTLIVKGFTG